MLNYENFLFMQIEFYDLFNMYIGIIKLVLLMTRLLNMQQTNFMYSQSVIKVIKGTAVQFTRSRENN
jgi:predicted CDP-diglyceride synthetase/phosphatidate cytidylyltransferase